MKSQIISLISFLVITACTSSADDGVQQRLAALEQRVQKLEAQRGPEKEAMPSSSTLVGTYSGSTARGPLSVSFDSPGVATFRWPTNFTEVARYEVKPNGILFDFKKWQYFMQRSGDTLSGTIYEAPVTIRKQ